MTLLWTIDAMAQAMGAETSGDMPDGVSGVSIDTRTIEQGDAYFAIKGDVHDGHKFVANAYRSGAAVSVVARDKLETLDDDGGPLLIVEDVLAAMEKLGRAARARTSAKIVAVTGSVGKTSTKEALRTALAACGKVHASAASYNNHWGVPLTLARMPEDTEYGVFEIGMNHPGEITVLVKMVQPDVAMINNVAAVHLGAFSSVDEIAHAKAEIFDGLLTDGTALLNADDERFELQKSIAESKSVKHIATFGEAAGSDVRLAGIELHDDYSDIDAEVFGTPLSARIGTPGRHHAQNALAVLAVAHLVGANIEEAAGALGSLQAVKGRGQRHNLQTTSGTFTLIDESYNANPTSMRAALALLGSTQPETGGRRIAVLGDMLELGPTSKELHADLLDAILEAGVDKVYLVGPDMTALRDVAKEQVSCMHGGQIEDIIDAVTSELTGGDVIMVKSSLGIRSGLLVNRLIETFAKAGA